MNAATIWLCGWALGFVALHKASTHDWKNPAMRSWFTELRQFSKAAVVNPVAGNERRQLPLLVPLLPCRTRLPHRLTPHDTTDRHENWRQGMSDTISDREAERLRKKIDFITRDGGYRTVMTDAESPCGILPRCTSPDHPADDTEQWDVLDCCETHPLIETWHQHIASVWVDSLHVIPALLDERELLRDQRKADDDWAQYAAELLAAVVAPACESDSYGNCATHGVLVLEAGAQCPHLLARAFLSSSRLHLKAQPTARAGLEA